VQLLTLARDLKRRKARERRTLFVVEGVRTVEELLRSTLAVRGALATRALRESARGLALLASLEARGVARDDVSERDFLSATDTEHPQGILVIAEVPVHTFQSLDPQLTAATLRLLVLDAIQDPGNAGTLVRTGAALGAAAVIALPGTADLWNAKAVRAAAGAHFRIPTVQGTTAELLAFLREHQVALWGAAADGTPVDALKPPKRLALAVGNEGVGLSAGIREAAGQMVALPMVGGVESLNVAVAAGVALYALRP
jgi:TrmH family RNA methyltransferase